MTVTHVTTIDIIDDLEPLPVPRLGDAPDGGPFFVIPYGTGFMVWSSTGWYRPIDTSGTPTASGARFLDDPGDPGTANPLKWNHECFAACDISGQFHCFSDQGEYARYNYSTGLRYEAAKACNTGARDLVYSNSRLYTLDNINDAIEGYTPAWPTATALSTAETILLPNEFGLGDHYSGLAQLDNHWLTCDKNDPPNLLVTSGTSIVQTIALTAMAGDAVSSVAINSGRVCVVGALSAYLFTLKNMPAIAVLHHRKSK